MGKNNKKAFKSYVFKVAGAKSLKKPKAKAVQLGLKNIKQAVKTVDAQFAEINKNPKSNKATTEIKQKDKKSEKKKATAEEISKTVQDIVKMDI